MTEFAYTINEQRATIEVDEDRDLARLASKAEELLASTLAVRGLEIDAQEKRYLRSKIATAITRDFLTRGVVDLGTIKVTGGERPVPNVPTLPATKPPVGKPLPEAENVYTLINRKNGQTVKRSYSPDQSIGAMYADIRQLYNLKISDLIVLTQIINDVPKEIPAGTLLSDLTTRTLYWDVKQYG